MNIAFPNSYIAWDLETSGFLDTPGSKIIEIGAMLVENGQIVKSKNWVLNHGIEIPAKITEITGITKDIIDAEGRDPKECYVEFIKTLGYKSLPHLTHNGIAFDIPFLLREVAENAVVFGDTDDIFGLETFADDLKNRALDSAAMFKAKYVLKQDQKFNEVFYDFAKRVLATKAYGKFNVGHCCDTLGIDRSNVTQHRALGDIELTHQIYQKLIAS